MRRIFSTAAALTLLGSAATAQTHLVIVTGAGFFPQVLYAQPGDTVEFYNTAETSEVITSNPASEGSGLVAWESPSIAPGSSYFMTIDETHVLSYFDPDPTIYSTTYTTDDSTTVDTATDFSGTISFELPPEPAT